MSWYIKRGGSPDSDLDFLWDQVVKVEKGWVEQEFVLLVIAAFPREAGLPWACPIVEHLKDASPG
jgi:hypothetical protein